MKKILINSSLLLMATVGNTLGVVLIDFGDPANNPTGLTDRFIVSQDGTAVIENGALGTSGGNIGFGETVFDPNDAQNGVLAGSLATIAVSGISNNTTGGVDNRLIVEIARSTADNFGVGPGGGPAGQSFGGSGLFFYTEGGTWDASDGSVTSTIDFSAYAGGGVSDLEFSLLGINRQFGSGGGAALDGADIVSVSALDTNGLAIDISGFFTESETPAFSSSGTTTVLFDSTGSATQANGSDHDRSDGNAAFNSGNQIIQSLTITYQAISEGSAINQASTGFLVSDIAFETIPEPSTFLLSCIGLTGFIFRRNRKS